MIEVRIRHDEDAEGHHLTEVPLESVNDVIPAIKPWGVYAQGPYSQVEDISGQFVYSEDSAYFEVVLHS